MHHLHQAYPCISMNTFQHSIEPANSLKGLQNWILGWLLICLENGQEGHHHRESESTGQVVLRKICFVGSGKPERSIYRCHLISRHHLRTTALILF
jgi:hypothetical protein